MARVTSMQTWPEPPKENLANREEYPILSAVMPAGRHETKTLVFLVTLTALTSCTIVHGQIIEADFTPWTVMGQVSTAGKGSVALEYASSTLNYSVELYNVTGMRSIEIHVGDPDAHGDVVAVLCAAAFPDASSVTAGATCAGALDQDSLLGPLLLPQGYHLDVSLLYERYIITGQSTVVVHTLGNPSGELGASPNALQSLGMAPIGHP